MRIGLQIFSGEFCWFLLISLLLLLHNHSANAAIQQILLWTSVQDSICQISKISQCHQIFFNFEERFPLLNDFHVLKYFLSVRHRWSHIASLPSSIDEINPTTRHKSRDRWQSRPRYGDKLRNWGLPVVGYEADYYYQRIMSGADEYLTHDKFNSGIYHSGMSAIQKHKLWRFIYKSLHEL